VIDWNSLALALGAPGQDPPRNLRATPLAGGSINRAFRLEFDSRRCFVKLNHADCEAMFVAERRGLEVIRQTDTIRVPEVYLTGRDGQSAYIVMEYLDLDGSIDRARQARALAAMHRCFGARFGFDCDNTIGSSPQPNPPGDDWSEFWRAHRLGTQLELARANGLDARLIDSGYRLRENLAHFFSGYRPRPSLLHGDLWSGNQGADADGNPVIFDPACYYGDHQADLAMMELFASPGERFFAVYREHFAIADGYPERRDLYNLYHLLNHANLFGGGYPQQARQLIDRLLAQLRA
jgi:protein-ribulosamine 3-kinase